MLRKSAWDIGIGAMSAPVLLSPSQAEPEVAEVFATGSTCVLSVSEERAFDGGDLPLGTVSLLAAVSEVSTLPRLIRRGAFEWRLPSLDEAADQVSRLLHSETDDMRRMHRVLDEVASIATRVGLIHPRFDPVAIEQMPFRRSTTIVTDTSGVLQGALDFAARFLHPAARVKVPAIAQMEIANLADRFLRIRRAAKRKRLRELTEHLTSQGGQRALLRIELHTDTEVERTYLLGDPLRSAFEKDSDRDLRDLDINSPIRSYADRLILEAARHHQAQSGPAHAVHLLTGDQGLARMALTEGIRPLYFTATSARDVFDQRLTGRMFHPFSGTIRHVPLNALLWELATAFGSARLTGNSGEFFEVCALGEHLSWAPYHAEQDLLWCIRGPRASGRPNNSNASEATSGRMSSRSRMQDSSSPSPARQNAGFLTFNVERMFQLICALDDRQEMHHDQVEEILRSKGKEYRRFLSSGGLIDITDGAWKASERLCRLSSALRNERIEDVCELLLAVPSFAAFAKILESLSTGTAMDTASLGRRLRTYRSLGEITLLCAAVAGEIYATPNVPDAVAFSKIALRCFSSLDREGQGLVATGEWLESLIRDEGIHPEVARRLLEEASETGLLGRSTEGSTTQLRFEKRTVDVLRTESGRPVVKRVYLYRGDYLIPGKASVSLRIKGQRT